MSKEALKLALEALETTTDVFLDTEGSYGRLERDAMDANYGAITAIREALAEQPAQQQDGETITQMFTGLPKRKLNELLAAGWQINGVCLQRTEEDGTVRRGAVTTGGMVLWWNQPAQQEPVAWMYDQAKYRENDLRGRQWAFNCFSQNKPWVDDMVRNLTPLYTRHQAREPLTDEEIEKVWRRVQANDFHDCVQPFARAIESAHGIKV